MTQLSIYNNTTAAFCVSPGSMMLMMFQPHTVRPSCTLCRSCWNCCRGNKIATRWLKRTHRPPPPLPQPPHISYNTSNTTTPKYPPVNPRATPFRWYLPHCAALSCGTHIEWEHRKDESWSVVAKAQRRRGYVAPPGIYQCPNLTTFVQHSN